MAWAVERRVESAAEFHARPLPDPVVRAVWRCTTPTPAIVLGSTQRRDLIDSEACAAARIEVVRRRSGGGAVLVDRTLLWVDVLLPATDPLWEPDVGRSALWLGRAWWSAFASSGMSTRLHEGALRRTRWSSAICFAGLAPGELTDVEGRKVVGISQRRTRAGARFQCAVLGSWEPEALLSLLDLAPAEREAAANEIRSAAAGTGIGHDELFEAFVRHLPH